MTTKLEYLLQRYHEVKALRDRTANQIAGIIGDDRWLMRRNIPGYAIMYVSQWMGHCRTLAALDHDIRCERQNPPREMVVH